MPTSPIDRVLTAPASPFFMAILDYALDNPSHRVEPQVTSLHITSDGFLLVANSNDPTRTSFEGSASNLEDNILGICRFVGLNPAETSEVYKKVFSKVNDSRRTH